MVQESAGFVTAIDPTITESLRLEGLAREIVSRVQRMRKDAALAVSDRIRLAVAGDAEVRAAVSSHGAWIAQEVLATELIGDPDSLQDHMAAETLDLDGVTVRVAFTRIV
jgi:isoleucyl-tRNA synthetase